MRGWHRHAAWLLAVLTGCGGSTPSSVAVSDPWAEMLAVAQSEQRDCLIRLSQQPILRFRGESHRRRGFDTLVANGAAFGVEAFDVELVDAVGEGHEPGLPRIPQPARGVVLPIPVGGWVGDGPPTIAFEPVLPVNLLVDAAGLPFATIECDGEVADTELRERIERARACRRSRDEAFAAAAATTGKERIAALQRGLQALDRWLVVRCYTAQLADLVASDDAAALEYARPLLREHEVLRACLPLRELSEEVATIDPRRLRRQLDDVVGKFPDLPEVAALAHCMQGSADLRRALDTSERDRIVERVRDAFESSEVEVPWIRQVAEVWIVQASHWQPR